MIKEVIKEKNVAQSKNLEVPKIYSKYLRATDEVHGEDCQNWLQRLKLKKESLGLLRQHKKKPYKQLLNVQHRLFDKTNLMKPFLMWCQDGGNFGKINTIYEDMTKSGK